MARKKSISTEQKLFEQYEHKGKKRLNNPPVGLVDAHTDNGGQKKKTHLSYGLPKYYNTIFNLEVQ